MLVASFHQGLEMDNIGGVILYQAIQCALIPPLVCLPEQDGLIAVHSINLGGTGKAKGFLYCLKAAPEAQPSQEKTQVDMGRGQGDVGKLAPDERQVKLGPIKGDDELIGCYFRFKFG